jgi:hypothetical protein
MFSIVCSSGAVFFGAQDKGYVAAVLSAIATICIGTEKSLLFREKWKIHLLIFTKLSNLSLLSDVGNLTAEQAAAGLVEITSSYAEILPVSERENAGTQ